MTIDISVWGPCCWKFLHTLSFAYPPTASRKRTKSMFTFLHSFAEQIPCAKCMHHMQQMLSEQLVNSASPHLVGRDALSRFIVDLHNQVNQRISKPQQLYADVHHAYMDAVEEQSTCGFDATVEKCTTEDDEEQAGGVEVALEDSARAARINVSSDAHDLTLLIGCAVGVLIVCVLMIVYGIWVGRSRRR
jgi:hypothetical protein